MIIPLALSSFTHLWNPSGFPIFHIDEGFYMEWTMDILKVLDPVHYVTVQNYYFHPYFGPLSLAGMLGIAGYPDSLNHSADAHSVEMVYFVPRILMGILVVIDTFLIYKICDRRYNRNVAFVASLLFAVMPITWLLRFVSLDNILLPFLLSSILFAVYTRESTSAFKNKNKIVKNSNKVLLVIISGVLLGLAIFTKETAFIMIPLVGFLIFTNNNKSWKMLGLWFVPVILLPLIWPASLFFAGHFDDWLNNIQFQTHRVSKPLVDSIVAMFKADPILMTLAFVGIGLAALRRDLFVLLWTIPFIIFFSVINFVSMLHLIVILPVLCISAGMLILDISYKINNRYQKTISKIFVDEYSRKRKVRFTIKKYLLPTFKSSPGIIGLIIISAVAIFGLTSTVMLVSLNLNSPYFEAVALLTNYLPDKKSTAANYQNIVTVVSRDNDYIWIPEYVFGKDQHVYQSYFWNKPIKAGKYLLVVNDQFKNLMSKNDERAKRLHILYNNTVARATFESNSDYHDLYKYPYTSISDKQVLASVGLVSGTKPGTIEIRTNYLPLEGKR